MFSKVLVANRGEIAIRAFRAAYEVGARTVAVFPHEDRWSEHRLKADEAYEIGERGHPVRAYLDPDAIVAVAVRSGADAVETCRREAEGALGDREVFIEQAVVEPRHIEVQILADGEGNVIHLFERDCSVQRRHQKVVEIAPAPHLDPALRDRMCADA